MDTSLTLRVLALSLLLCSVLLLSGGSLATQAVARGARLNEPSSSDVWQLTSLFSSDLQSSATFPNCRFGVTAWGSQQQSFDLISNFGVGIYQDFTARSTLAPQMAGAEHVQMLRLSQNRPNDPAHPDEPITNCGPDYGYSVNFALHDNPGGLGSLVAARPGALWIVGNEPDRRLVQDDLCPQQYAEAYHDVYHFIKERDPSAQVAVAGLVQVSPGRLQYLDIVLDTYLQRYGRSMPVDVWTMHAYILPETGNGNAHIAVGTDPELAIEHSTNCADPNSYCYAEHDDVSIFVWQIKAMRQWMEDRGYQDRPLLLTEFGILLPYHYYGTCYDQICPSNPPPDYGCFCDTNGETFHPERVANFAEASFNYLLSATSQDLGYPLDDDRLIQQFIWYSVQTGSLGHASNLVEEVEPSYYLTVPGQRWNDYVMALPEELNMFPGRVPAQAQSALDGVSPVTVTLTAEIYNSGNVTASDPLTVTFYQDAALTQPIGSAALVNLKGCGRASSVVTTTWANLPTGKHAFWVDVDSGETIQETNESDNVRSSFVLANPIKVYLPLTMMQR